MSMQDPVVPYSGQRRRYRPEIGQTLTVDLPGESVRALIDGVVNVDACTCVIVSTPIATPRHGYNRDDCIPVRRGVKEPLGIECWEVVSDREMMQREHIARFQEEEEAKAAEADAERIKQLRAEDLATQEKAKAAAALAATPWYKRPKG